MNLRRCITITYDDINKILDNINSECLKISFLLSLLDLPTFDQKGDKFTLVSILRLYIFKLIKGFRTYELLTKYLLGHEEEAFQLGFFKNEDNRLELPPKRTFNHYLRTKLSGDQKKEIHRIADDIIEIAVKRNILLDINIVKEAVIKEKKNYDLEIREATKYVKKIFYPEIDFKIGKNAIYTSKDLLDTLVHIASNKFFTNIGANAFKTNNDDKRCPSGDLLMYHFRKIGSIEKITGMFDKILDFILNVAKNNYNVLKDRKHEIAYDIHKIEYYGKEGMDYVCSSKFDRGTSNFIEFLTCSIVVKGRRFIIDIIPIHPLNDLAKLLDKSLKKVKSRISIERAYFDRGFNRQSVFRVLKDNKILFLMPMSKNDKVKTYMDKAEGINAMIFHDFKVGEESVILTFVDDEKGVKNPFISNFELAPCIAYRLYGMYSKRWGIETSYRQLDHEFLARTTSKNYNIRLFYFLFATCFFNLWVLVNICVSLSIYGEIKDKPIIPGRIFGILLQKVQIEYSDPGG